MTLQAERIFAVSWQLHDAAATARIIARDDEPDFAQWAVASDDEHDWPRRDWPVDNFAFADFARADDYYLALHIDVLRPHADYLDLEFPGSVWSFALDLGHIAGSMMLLFPGFDAPSRPPFLYYAVTSRNDHPLSFARRTLIFPDTGIVNAACGTSYSKPSPQYVFAAAVERWLNAHGRAQIRATHYDGHFAPGYLPEEFSYSTLDDPCQTPRARAAQQQALFGGWRPR
ncbi:MAG: hypothetical protein LBV50_00115 [Novosphingobium sp.]|jgi:hypothetical protein|nr:hypothetical protein [Novosphingobium sp.]